MAHWLDANNGQQKKTGLMWFDNLVLFDFFASERMKAKQPERKKKIVFFASE